MSEKCSCGHKREDHENGTGNCKECDRDAAYGMNADCQQFRLRTPTPIFKPREKSLEERVAALEAELTRLRR
jgi:hypothetical protein